MKNKYITIASVLMTIVGLLRGFGGLMLILHGNNTIADGSSSPSPSQNLLMGTGLIIVFILFVISSWLLLRHKTRAGYIFSWISIAALLAGGVINGFVLFGAPKIQGQVLNLSACILIAFCLFAGKIQAGKGKSATTDN